MDYQLEIIYIYLFVIGCCLGSFINVLIHRLPLNQSIVYPYSSCPKCKAKIKWFDNLPVLSWFLLNGKCRTCKTKIAFSYPIIELFTAPNNGRDILKVNPKIKVTRRISTIV